MIATPAPAPAPAKAEPAVAKEEPAGQVAAERQLASPLAAAAAIDALRDRKKAPAKGSSIGSNVLLFVAVIFAFVVVMVAVNKNAPKTVSPFQGGPPPSQAMGGGAAPAPATGGGAEGGEAAPPAGGGGSFSGQVKVAPDLANAVPPNAAVFIVVRAAGMPDMGPPLAVKRVDGSSLPAAFEVSESDIMMKGMPFTGPFDVYVRLDADGNAMTKNPGDITLSQPKTPVNPGDKGVEIVLDKRL